jgi:hypothetical protein
VRALLFERAQRRPSTAVDQLGCSVALPCDDRVLTKAPAQCDGVIPGYAEYEQTRFG